MQKVNYDLTRGYLDLIVTYFCIMIIVSRVDDRKAVLGLFNFACELQNGKKYAVELCFHFSKSGIIFNEIDLLQQSVFGSASCSYFLPAVNM